MSPGGEGLNPSENPCLDADSFWKPLFGTPNNFPLLSREPMPPYPNQCRQSPFNSKDEVVRSPTHSLASFDRVELGFFVGQLPKRKMVKKKHKSRIFDEKQGPKKTQNVNIVYFPNVKWQREHLAKPILRVLISHSTKERKPSKAFLLYVAGKQWVTSLLTKAIRRRKEYI